MPWLPSLAVLASLSGSSYGPSGPVLPCARSGDTLSLNDTPPVLAGTWDLELYALGGKHSALQLELRLTDSAQRTAVHPFDNQVHQDSSYLYLGILAGDATAVGLSHVTELSWDPDRPGVKGRWQLRWSPHLRFIIGSDENDRGKMSLDGWAFWLDAKTVTPMSMSGTWEAGVHVTGYVKSGWWCAFKRGP